MDNHACASSLFLVHCWYLLSRIIVVWCLIAFSVGYRALSRILIVNFFVHYCVTALCRAFSCNAALHSINRYALSRPLAFDVRYRALLRSVLHSHVTCALWYKKCFPVLCLVFLRFRSLYRAFSFCFVSQTFSYFLCALSCVVFMHICALLHLIVLSCHGMFCLTIPCLYVLFELSCDFYRFLYLVMALLFFDMTWGTFLCFCVMFRSPLWSVPLPVLSCAIFACRGSSRSVVDCRARSCSLVVWIGVLCDAPSCLSSFPAHSRICSALPSAIPIWAVRQYC